MAKARITVSFEYEIKPESYERNMTLEQMVETDVASYNEHPDSLIEVLGMFEFEIDGTLVTD